LIFATRAFHHVGGTPFQLYCDHFVRAMERAGEKALMVTLDRGKIWKAKFRISATERHKLTQCTVTTAGGGVLHPYASSEDRLDYRVPASGSLVLTWE